MKPIEGIIPVQFHPYPSTVTARIVTVEYNSGDTISRFETHLLRHFNESGIKCIRDNKIVFECQIHARVIFYGFKDWRFSVGYGVITR